MMIAIFAGILIGISFSLETLGFYFRGIGVKYGLSSLGYSMHVQFATISRLGTFLGLPLVGWMLDNNASPKDIIFFTIIVNLTFIIICRLSFMNKSFEKIMNFIFFFMTKRILNVENNIEIKNYTEKSLVEKDKSFLMLMGSLSYIMVVGGMYFIFLSSAIWNDYRATILQLSPVLTSIGTLISVIYFDPKISSLIDNQYNAQEILNIILISRSGSLLALTIVSIFSYAFV